mmetsp:Transcript_56254/g.102926  ORF Transcript_56254/g.102926 Transcript_56254/m.102926 type:complete len:241 (+) Transcript_56254:3583-4305(+)
MSVDGVKFHLLLMDSLSQRSWELDLHLLQSRPRAVHHENTTWPDFAQHVKLRKERCVVAGNIISTWCVFNLIFAFDFVGTEAQVRDCRSSSLLGGVVEVALREELGTLTNDRSCCLVGTHCAIRSQSKEKCLCGSLWNAIDCRSEWQVRVGHIINNPHCEMVLGQCFLQIIEHCLDMSWRELLASKAVIATDNFGEPARFTKGCENIRMKWQGSGQVFFRTVQHSDALGGLWQALNEVLH